MSRSTFSVLFYANKSKLKNGIVPIMGRVTINGTQSQFSCKQSIPLDLWDVKGNRAKGRSREALQLNRDLDNIKAQLIKHYQHLSDKEGFVTAEVLHPSGHPAKTVGRSRIQETKTDVSICSYSYEIGI